MTLVSRDRTNILFREDNKPDPRHETTRFPALPTEHAQMQMAKPKVVGYKIRRRDGLYSTGGSTPEFTHVGKTWSNKQGLHSHFACIQEYREYAMRRHRGDPIPDFVAQTYAGCDVVALIEHQHIDIESYRSLQCKTTSHS